MNVQQKNLHPSVAEQESPDSWVTAAAGGCFDKKAYKAAWYRANRARILYKTKVRNALNKEKKREYDIAYRAKNFDVLRQKKLVYLSANLEAIRERRSRYYRLHKAHFQEYHKIRASVKREEFRKYKERYYLNNRTKILKKSSEYARTHPDKCLAATNKRRALKHNSTVGDISAILRWEKRWKSKAVVICYWCQKPTPVKNCHSDHIIPLCDHGPHCLSNLCISCSTCNLRKNRSTLADWNKRLTQPALL